MCDQLYTNWKTSTRSLTLTHTHTHTLTWCYVSWAFCQKAHALHSCEYGSTCSWCTVRLDSFAKNVQPKTVRFEEVSRGCSRQQNAHSDTHMRTVIVIIIGDIRRAICIYIYVCMLMLLMLLLLLFCECRRHVINLMIALWETCVCIYSYYK